MKTYKTKQGELILNYLKSMSGKHIQASDIKEYFVKENISIGLTTIYRHLSKLEAEGKVHKYVLDNTNSACFEYINPGAPCKELCFHLKCEECEKLIHFDCAVLGEIGKHMFEAHAFTLNPRKTVYYGCCSECKKTSQK